MTTQTQPPATGDISLAELRQRALQPLNEKLGWLRVQRQYLTEQLDRLAYREKWSFDHVPVFEPFDIDVLVGAMQGLLNEQVFGDVLRVARGHQRCIHFDLDVPPEKQLSFVLEQRSAIDRYVDCLVEDATIAIADATNGTFIERQGQRRERA